MSYQSLKTLVETEDHAHLTLALHFSPAGLENFRIALYYLLDDVLNLNLNSVGKMIYTEKLPFSLRGYLLERALVFYGHLWSN